ncbi:gliding motility-associated C-terminal domain-containing protein [Aquirufa aurantiipilula]
MCSKTVDFRQERFSAGIFHFDQFQSFFVIVLICFGLLLLPNESQASAEIGVAVKFKITGSATQTAGVSQTITITAVDGLGITDNSYVGFHDLIFSGANSSILGNTPKVNSVAFGTSSSITFTNGVATATLDLFRAETALIQVSDGTLSSSGADGLSIVVGFGALGRFDQVLSSPEQIVDRNFTGTYTVTAQDSYANVITNFNSAITPLTVIGNSSYAAGTFTLGYGGNVLNRASDFVNGVANLQAIGIKYSGTTNASGNILIRNADLTIISPISANIRGGNAVRLAITGGTTRVAGTSSAVTITALDTYGNTSYEYTGIKSLLFSGANTSTSGNIPRISTTNFGTNTNLTFSAGFVTSTMTLFKVENPTISVSDGTLSSSGSSNLTVTVNPAVLNKFEVVIQNPQQSERYLAGVNTVTAQDLYNNTVTSFNAATNNVTVSTTLSGSITGLSGGNKLNSASDFVNGIANLTTLGMIYLGAEGSGTFTFRANTGPTGTSQIIETAFADDDSDGIPNSMECFGTSSLLGTCADFDGDGRMNSRDTDSDNDGINDSLERNMDSDGDRLANYLDLDSDNDGIPDATEGIQDTDGDGTPNYIDLDSDGDGLMDAWEASDNARGTVDQNYDGKIDINGVFADVNANGLADVLETILSGKVLPLPDTDRDGAKDYVDTDSDNDGISDMLEGSSDPDKDAFPNYRDLDSDGDWLGDQDERNVDNDGDGVSNYLDADSDGDGIPDAWEGKNKCATCTTLKDDWNDGWDDRGQYVLVIDTDKDGSSDFLDLDSDNDCLPDAVELGDDLDGDELANFRDLDSDNDGIGDSIEAVFCTKPVDSDKDGKADFEDADSDNDLIPDKIEVGSNPAKPLDSDGDGLVDYQDVDSDGDGLLDSAEAGKEVNNPLDSDSDGILDFRDTDSDNDAILDKIEVGANTLKPLDSDNDGIFDHLDIDSDNDSIADKLEAGTDPSIPVDTDADGQRDYVDTDSDADAIPDQIEMGADLTKPQDTDGDGKWDFRDTDSDNDGILDLIEAGQNPNKPIDSDGDIIADFMDIDSDNDSILDKIEAGSDSAKPRDTDLDAKPDYIDSDSDNDGLLDSLEVGTNSSIPLDTDQDGVANYRDLDSDNDGLLDKLEAGNDLSKPLDTDKDGLADYIDIDSDNDSMVDRLEAGADFNRPVNTDRDALPDYRDTDSDNDLIPDKVEVGSDPTKPMDSDRDGIFDYQDVDSDNNGILDATELGLDSNNPIDTDKNGIPDYRDLDNDGDGISDLLELDVNYGGLADCDNDGISNMQDKDVCEPFAPQGISPNGDGKNDKLIIPGLLSFPKHHISVFNRAGSIIFESDNYKNDWGGELNFVSGQSNSSQLVPDGVYYYVVDFAGVKPSIQSFLYVNRLNLK